MNKLDDLSLFFFLTQDFLCVQTIVAKKEVSLELGRNVEFLSEDRNWHIPESFNLGLVSLESIAIKVHLQGVPLCFIDLSFAFFHFKISEDDFSSLLKKVFINYK